MRPFSHHTCAPIGLTLKVFTICVVLASSLRCTGPAAPLDPGLLPMVREGVAAYWTQTHSLAYLDALIDRVRSSSAASLVLASPASQVVAPSLGVVVQVGGATTTAELAGVDLEWRSAGGATLKAQLADLALEITLDIPGELSCSAVWAAESPVLTVEVGALRPKNGALQLFVANAPPLEVAQTKLNAKSCSLGGVALPGDLTDIIRSQLLSRAREQLGGALASALVDAMQYSYGLDLPTAGATVAPATSPSDHEAMRFQLTSSAGSSPSAPALLNDSYGLRLAMDLAVFSANAHPCAPEIPPPTELGLYAPPVADVISLWNLPGKESAIFAITIADKALEGALVHALRAGLLCVQSPTTGNIKVSSWTDAVPSLQAFPSDSMVRTRLRPGGRPQLRFMPWPTTDQGGSASTEIELPDTALDIYVVVDGAELRAYTVRGTLKVHVAFDLDAQGIARANILAAEVADALWQSPMPLPLPNEPNFKAAQAMERALHDYAVDLAWFRVKLPPGAKWTPLGTALLDPSTLVAGFVEQAGN